MATQSSFKSVLILTALAAIDLNCYGSIGGDNADPSSTQSASASLVVARVRRLSPTEYQRSLVQLLGASDLPTVALPADPVFDGYDNRADDLKVTSVHVETLWAAAPKLASMASQQILKAPACTLGSAVGDPCASQLLTDFASRAYRRPVSPDEVADLMTVYATARAGVDAQTSLTQALAVVFQSAGMLYRTELGSATSSIPTSTVSLTPSEIADELSFLLTQGPPDAALMAAAAQGELQTADGRETQARRLMSLPEGHSALGVFASEWLQVAGIATVAKDATVFPNWEKVRGSALGETESFFAAAVIDDKANLGSLFTATWTIADDTLASFYGSASNPGGRVNLPPEQRAGVLTQVSVLAQHARSVDDSPVQRGHMVRTRFLCQPIPPPPSTLIITPPPSDPTLTTRERFAAHSSNPTCAGCHTLMDPIGFSFENYDAVGAWRTTDNGKPVDASGNLTVTDVDGSFSGAVMLGSKLASSAEARACFAKNWLEFAMAHGVIDTDLPFGDAFVATTGRDFTAGNGSISDLMVATVRSDLFVLRGPQSH